MWSSIVVAACCVCSCSAQLIGLAMRASFKADSNVAASQAECVDAQRKCAAKCANVVYTCTNGTWGTVPEVVDTFCPCDPGLACENTFFTSATDCSSTPTTTMPSGTTSPTTTPLATTSLTTVTSTTELDTTTSTTTAAGNGNSNPSVSQPLSQGVTDTNSTWITEKIPQCYQFPGCELGKMVGLKVGVNIYKTPFSLFVKQTYTPPGVLWHFSPDTDTIQVFPMPTASGYYEFCICFPKNDTHSIRFQLLACPGTDNLCSESQTSVYPFGGFIDTAWVKAQKNSFVEFGVINSEQLNSDFIYPSGCCGFYPPINNKNSRPIVNGGDYLDIGCVQGLNCALTSRTSGSPRAMHPPWRLLMTAALLVVAGHWLA